MPEFNYESNVLLTGVFRTLDDDLQALLLPSRESVIRYRVDFRTDRYPWHRDYALSNEQAVASRRTDPHSLGLYAGRWHRVAVTELRHVSRDTSYRSTP